MLASLAARFWIDNSDCASKAASVMSDCSSIFPETVTDGGIDTLDENAVMSGLVIDISDLARFCIKSLVYCIGVMCDRRM